MAQVTMKEMLDAGVHFGHQTQRWNPKMKPFVYTDRGGIHIIDLQKTVIRAQKAADFVKQVAATGGKIIFVGTKKQAIEPITEAAKKCGQFYVTKRWLGGMLTNFETIKASIDRLRRIDQMREKGEFDYMTKKERSRMEKEYTKLNESLSGIRDMKEMPSAMFVVDMPKEHIAVAEAKRLGIPVVGIADTNSDPESIEYPIPGNDDAIRAIKLFANMVADSFMEGSVIWEQKLRAVSDKQSDNAKDEKPTRRDQQDDNRGRRPARGAKPADAQAAAPAKKAEGPTVVKATKARKLVAAGLAEDVEIQAELENPDVVAAEEEVDAKETETTKATETKKS